MTSKMPSRDPASPHEGHDLLLVAAHATGDTTGSEAIQARELISGCHDCRDLATDLAALRSAARQLPPAQRARDFRLSPETAARLRAPSPWQRFVDGLVAPRGFGRPLAGALMTQGLAGLMVWATPLGSPLAGTSATRDSGERALLPSDAGAGFSGGVGSQAGGSTATPGDQASQDSSGRGSLDTAKGAPGVAGPSASPAVPPAAAVAAPTTAAPMSSPAPARLGAEPGLVTTMGGSRASPGAEVLTTGGAADGAGDDTRPSAWTGPSPLAVGSLALLVSGLTLLVVRRRTGPRSA
jgi:hypothetical protein